MGIFVQLVLLKILLAYKYVNLCSADPSEDTELPVYKYVILCSADPSQDTFRS
jgi:hypothetical protein